MKNLSLLNKLLVAFGCCMLIVSGLSGLALTKLSTMNDNVSAFADNRLPKAVALGQLEANFAAYRTALYRHISASPDQLSAADQAVTQARRNTIEASRHLATLVAAPEAKAATARIETILPTIIHRDDVALDLSRRGEDAAASQTLLSIRTDSERLASEIAGLRSLFQKQESGAKSAAAEDFASSKLGIAVAVAVALGVILMTLFAMVKLVSRPLRDLNLAIGEMARGKLEVALGQSDRRDEVGKLAGSVTLLRDQLIAAERAKQEQTSLIVESVGTGLSALAEGNLTARIDANLEGPFAKLKGDFNAAMDAVSATLSSVNASAAGIANGAGDIRQASDDLSRRTEQQAASLEETAAAMHQITTTVRETAGNAVRANGVVQEARADAMESADVVQRAVAAMTDIERSSGEISDIIAVIDGIAFQTNLLALNAGVEAARAGDAGKGFAVVASEVRALAQRSAEAAKDVKAKITASTEQVDVGVALVGQTGDALGRISGRIGEISTLVSDIAAAAEQQAIGLQQVNTAVSEMDGVTQQNAAMVEEATAAARSLAEETENMSRQVARFKLANESRVSRAASPVHVLQDKAAQVGARIAASARANRAHAAPAMTQEDWSSF
ncbi:methyl-accepting chemotaxis protein [Sphingomonas sp. DT-51]|uniref:methyl-accepting chemotaxis protein n=1 Tax=Sphingomonas sp. DT-51 TaxID=3396165 RepID=UPI003F1B6DD7